ncbi:hypothetical protein DIURU_003420 [Diutina rugosa]|uniref:Uncharacterized protein n=1 Tax=Diutina rugosa TaxID=5481 RepID=A0A642UKX1_DIURU|nr:uncharacterized protein DIURU_003420 [Diutina rugosa]KAA8901050.1 hypothetical protein DIURU_003420 [Diutina rugosa]
MAVFVCIKQFNARLGDELSLKVGDKVEVLADDSEYNDGWYMGKNLLTGDVGLYPKSFTHAAAADAEVASVQKKLAQVSLDEPQDEFCDVSFEQETMSPKGDVLSPKGDAIHTPKQVSRTVTRPANGFHTQTPPPSAALPAHPKTNGTTTTTTASPAPSNTLASPSLSSRTTNAGAIAGPPIDDVVSWSPDDVANYFSKQLKFDQSIANSFKRHEISGQILLELDLSHLKELEIDSFGTRFQIYKEIEKLKSPQIARNKSLSRSNSARLRQKDSKSTITDAQKSSPSRTVSPHSNINGANDVFHSDGPPAASVPPHQNSDIFQTPKQQQQQQHASHRHADRPVERHLESLGAHSKPPASSSQASKYPTSYKPKVSAAPSNAYSSTPSSGEGLISPSAPSQSQASPYQASPNAYPSNDFATSPAYPPGYSSLLGGPPPINGTPNRGASVSSKASHGATSHDASFSRPPGTVGEGGRPTSSIYDSPPTRSHSSQHQRQASNNSHASEITISTQTTAKPLVTPSVRSSSIQRPYSTMEPMDRAASMLSFASEDGKSQLPKSAATVNAVAAAAAAASGTVSSVPGTFGEINNGIGGQPERHQSDPYRPSLSTNHRDPNAPTPPPKDRTSMYRRREKNRTNDEISVTPSRQSVYRPEPSDLPRLDTSAASNTTISSSAPPHGPLESKRKGPTKLTSPAKVKRASGIFSPKQRKSMSFDASPDVGEEDDDEMPLAPPSMLGESRSSSAPTPSSTGSNVSPITADPLKPSRLKTLRTTSTQNFKQLGAGGKKQKTSAFQEGIQEVSPEVSAKSASFSGWMSKRSSNSLSWRSRFFVLHGTRLSYFTSLKDKREKGLIDITAHRVMPVTSEKGKGDEDSSNDKYIALYAASTGYGRYCFKLVPPAPGFKKGLTFTQPKVHYFAVDSPEEMRGWLKALMAATIDIDDSVPVVSSCSTPTVSLAKAQELLAKAREETRQKDLELRSKGVIQDIDEMSPSDYTQFLHDHSFDLPGSPLNDSHDDTTVSSTGGGLLSVGGSLNRSKLSHDPHDSTGMLAQSPSSPSIDASGGFTSPYMLAGGMMSPRSPRVASPTDTTPQRSDYFSDPHLSMMTSSTGEGKDRLLIDATPKSASSGTVHRQPSVASKVLSYTSDAAGNLTFQMKKKPQ